MRSSSRLTDLTYAGKGFTYILAHRGASGYEPENTLRSFKTALEDGANALEFDVHQSRDGTLVVIHDETVDRTTNGTGYVNEMRLEELKQLDAGEGERIPTLQEAVDLLRGRCLMFIEVKPLGIEADLVNALKAMGARRDVVIFGRLSSVTRIRRIDPTLKWAVPSFAMAQPIRLGSLYTGITADMVSHFHEKGSIVIPQTDKKEEMVHLIKIGVDGIVTNWPRTLVSVAKELRI